MAAERRAFSPNAPREKDQRRPGGEGPYAQACAIASRKISPKSGDLAVADAVDFAQFVKRRRTLFGHFQQGPVGEDHIGGDALLLRDFAPQFAQSVENPVFALRRGVDAAADCLRLPVASFSRAARSTRSTNLSRPAKSRRPVRSGRSRHARRWPCARPRRRKAGGRSRPIPACCGRRRRQKS